MFEYEAKKATELAKKASDAGDEAGLSICIAMQRAALEEDYTTLFLFDAVEAGINQFIKDKERT